MASNIKFKRSAVENRVPTTAQLELGELALNTYDGKLYTEKNSGSASVVEIGSILSSLVVDGANGGGGGDVTFHGTTAGRDLLWDYSGNRLDFKDNVMARFGDTGDLQISHNGTDSIIKDAGVGRLKILGGFQVKNVGDSQTLITANTSGANATNVELYNSNAIRLTTTADGVDISGTGSLKLPVGTTAQRNSSPTAGDMRYNSTTGSFEGYTTGWGELGGSGIGIGSTSVNPGSGVVNPLVGVGFTTINFVGAGLSVTGYGSTVVVDLGGAVSRKYGRKIHAYTATANQTTFAGLSYTNAAAQISVYLNGAKLSAATYTATSGSTVVLGTGASVGDEIEIICIDSGVDLTRNVTSYTATANQTTFTGLGYSDGGDLDVYLNGIRLAQSDYTANNGTSLVLATGASVGDLLEVVDMGQGAQWSSGFGADPDDIYRLNGGVGIGTTNPTDKLNIVGNVEVVGILTATHYGDGSNLSGIDTDKIEEGNSSVEVIDSGSNGKVALTLDGTERYRFTDGSFNLHQSTPIRLTGIAGGTGGGMHLDGTGGNGRIAVFGNSGTLSLLHSTASSDTNMGVFNKTGSVDLYHNGSKKFETAAYGVNVTGTTDTDGLVVSGVTTTSGAATVGGILTITGNQISGSSKILLSGGGGSNTTIYSGGTAYSDFIFTTLQGGLSRTIATLDQDGCLNLNRSDGGIVVAGVSTLSGNTTVGGNLTITGNLQVDGTQTTVNSTTMTVDDKNIVLGSGAANDAAADGGGITLESGNGNKTFNWVDSTDAWTSSEHIQVAAGKQLGFADDTNTYIDRPAADTIRFTTGGSERVRITSTGNIGVAGDTGTDYSLLDGMVINTANGSAGLIINSSSSSHNAYMSFGYGSGSGTSHNDQYSAYIGRLGDNTLILGTDNSIRATITSDGITKFDRYGGTAGKGRLEFGNSGEQYIEGYDTGNAGSGSYLTIGSNTDERLRIDSSGRLMVGQNSAYAATGTGNMMLTVTKNATSRTDAAINNQSSGDNASAAVVLATHGQDYILEATGSGNTTDGVRAFRILKGTSERLRITSAGRVGINQSSPEAMLQVDYDYANSEVGLRLRAASGSGTKTWQLSEINGTAGVFTIRNATNNQNILNISGTSQCVYSSNFGFGDDAHWKIRPNTSNTELAFEYATSSTLADTNIKMFLNPSGRVLVKTVPHATSGTMGDYGLMFQASSAPTDGQVIQGITFNPHNAQVGRARAGIAALANANGGSHPVSGADLVFMTRYSADGHDLDVATDERLRITSSGNVLIAGTDANANDGADDLIVGTTSGSDNHGITIKSPSNKYGRLYFADGNSSPSWHVGQIEYNHSDNSLNIYTGGHKGFVINSAGGHNFYNNNSYTASTLAECDSDAIALNIRKTRNGQTKAIAIGNVGGADRTGIQAYDTSDDSSNSLTINPFGGKIGIGCQPDELLHIRSVTSTAPLLEIEHNQGTGFKAQIGLRGNDLEIRGSSGQMEFYTGNVDGASSTERMRIKDDGKIGMNSGNNVPLQALHILDNHASNWDGNLHENRAVLRLETHWNAQGERAIGDYGSGIVFNHLGGHSAQHNDNMHAFIGLRVHSTPGHETSKLVFATNAKTGSSDHDAGAREAMHIKPDGAIHMAYGTNDVGSTSNIERQKLTIMPSINSGDNYDDNHIIAVQQYSGNWEQGTGGADTSFGLGWMWSSTGGGQQNQRAGIAYDHKGSEQFKIWSSYGAICFYTDNATSGNETAETCDTHALRIEKSGDVNPGVNNSQDLGSSSLRWRNLYTMDLQLSNESGDGNDVDGTTGNYTIQEGEDNLYLINNKSGKKYKFNLTEVH